MTLFKKNIKREIITTNDGSKTIHFPEINESYHSKHGAYQEAQHVFIKSGLSQIEKQQISILEVGFGTGLNAILTYIYAKNKAKTIDYHGLEAFPVSDDEINAINYPNIAPIQDYQEVFQKFHTIDWNVATDISNSFTLKKIQTTLENFHPDKSHYDLIYFDAFGPRVQPEMWTLEIFQKIFNATRKSGVFVTYSCRGQVRRDLLTAGFKVEKIPGPPGKREMLRAVKV